MSNNVDKYHPEPDEVDQKPSIQKRRLPINVMDSRNPNAKSAFDLDRFLSAINSLAADGDFRIDGYGKFFQLGTAESDHFREDLLKARVAEIEVATGVFDGGNNRTSVTVRLLGNNDQGISYTFRFKEDGSFFNYSSSDFELSDTPSLPDSGKKSLP
jgi:hypothetical protein